MLELNTLGTTEVKLNGTPSNQRIDKRRTLLLVYLAETGIPQSRKKMAQMLWPEADPELANTRMRTLLSRMRREGYDSYLQIDRSTLSLNKNAEIYYDLNELRNLITNPEEATVEMLISADKIYQHQFLVYIFEDDFPSFADWIISTRYEIEVFMVRAYYKLISLLFQQNNMPKAIKIAEQLITLDPYTEEAHVLYTKALIADERIAEAVRHLEQYRCTMIEAFAEYQLSTELEKLNTILSKPSKTVQFIRTNADKPQYLASQKAEQPTVSSGQLSPTRNLYSSEHQPVSISYHSPSGFESEQPITQRAAYYDRYESFQNHNVGMNLLADRERELIILRTLYNIGTKKEWVQHAAQAHGVGLSRTEILQICLGVEISDWTAKEANILLAVDQIQKEGKIGNETAMALQQQIGEAALFDLIHLVGMHTTLETIRKTFTVPHKFQNQSTYAAMAH